MVIGLSSSILTTFGNSWTYGGDFSSRRYYKLRVNSRMPFVIDEHFPWNHYVMSSYLRSNPLRRRDFRAEAGWLFNKGSNQGVDANVEQSESANEDIVIFFFQLDLATRVQYALNREEYDIARELRNKLTEVEAEIMKQQEAKRGLSSKSEAQDKALSLIRLRADLKNAVESENYALAAELRDQVRKTEEEAVAASTKAQAYEHAEYAFRLGQKVHHRVFGYRAVICGMDPLCCESESWMENSEVEKLPRGSNQPFYQVLVDVREDPNLLVAYVAEDNLKAPDKPDLARFDHPYTSFLFYGVDVAGDFIPIKQLRDKYNKPRHEAPIDLQDEDSSDNT